MPEFDAPTVTIVTDVTQLPQPLLELFDDMFRHAMKAAKAEDDLNYEGWYCIQMKPVICPGCGEPMCYVEPPHLHLIIVWEDKDDPHMLAMAQKLKDGRPEIDPDIREYHPMMGHCISWEDVVSFLDEIPDEDD